RRIARDGRELLERLRPEAEADEVARLAHHGLAAHLVEAKDDVHVLVIGRSLLDLGLSNRLGSKHGGESVHHAFSAMRFRYEKFDPSKHGRAELESMLRRLFHAILVRTDGDVEEALRWLEIVAERHGLFPPGYTIDDFRRSLEREREIRETEAGALEL